MSYKVGDKFIVEIEEIYNGDLAKHEEHMHLHRIKGFNSLVLDEYGLDKLQQINPKLKIEDIDDMLAEYDLKKESYEKGLNDDWELAKKLFADMSDSDLNEIFGKDWNYPKLMRLTPQEALAKIEAYEESKVFKVGDVVRRVLDDEKYLIITKENDSVFEYGVIELKTMTLTRITGDLSQFEKTGRHIDIEHLLEQIRGNE